MRKIIVVASGVLLIAALAAERASAQCAFPHPAKAAQFKVSLVPAFVPCNACLGAACLSGPNAGELCATDADCPNGGCGNVDVLGYSCAAADCPAPAFCHGSNASTDIGIASCKTPITFADLPNAPADSWRWGPKSSGTVSFKPIANKLFDPMLNPAPNTADVAIRLALNDVRDDHGVIAQSNGSASPERRTTFEDRAGGDMTVIDLGLPSFYVPVVGGRARVKTTANALLNVIPAQGLPGCTVLELVNFTVRDENGAPFARLGLFVPDLPNS
jgi:hypothetical protein